MQKLYTKCPETNSEKAIRTLYSHEDAKTAGVDGTSMISNITQERIIREFKLRLRRYKLVQSRKVQTAKGNGEFRELTIINLFDRIARQAVYQIISPILEEQMSKHSCGFKKGIGAKIPVSRLATTLNRNKDIYTVESDFKKCFDNIPLDKAIGSLLANCCLTQLDRFMEETFILNTVDKGYAKNYKRHEKNWIPWNTECGKKIHCNYCRYAEDTFITCHNEFKIVKSGRSVWVLVDSLKQFKFNTYAQCLSR